jgi:hypothetical protein
MSLCFGMIYYVVEDYKVELKACVTCVENKRLQARKLVGLHSSLPSLDVKTLRLQYTLPKRRDLLLQLSEDVDHSAPKCFIA